MRHLWSVTDRDTRKKDQTATPYSGRSMTGGDQRISRDQELIKFLAKVHAEMVHESREWPCFNQRKLGIFLRNSGVDLDAAVKAHEDACPPPRKLGDLALCLDSLKGASFLVLPTSDTCLLLSARSQRDQHARISA